MRVIAGTHRGRRLQGPQGRGLRPTSDRVREALFSILGNRLPQSGFLDLYAGTGAVAIEALSRGARHVTCVESDREAFRLLRQNVADCGMTNQVTAYPETVKRFFEKPEQWKGQYDIVFADPPYASVDELPPLLQAVDHDRLFSADSWLVVEHAAKTTLPVQLGPGTFLRRYPYGDTALSIFVVHGQTQP
jgi:16S rRNA (guanine966-N2)-methyltransferase